MRQAAVGRELPLWAQQPALTAVDLKGGYWHFSDDLVVPQRKSADEGRTDSMRTSRRGPFVTHYGIERSYWSGRRSHLLTVISPALPDSLD